MATIIISDFRGKQLQHNTNNTDYTFISDSAAEYNWFKTCVVEQLPNMSLSTVNVVIMLGFNDCVYSCLWDSFNIDKIAENYVTTINELAEQYQNLTFYVNSVNPVDGPYQFGSDLVEISAKALNKKIETFNKALLKADKAKFIDSYNYLKSTGFNTRDGVRYTHESCKSLLSYISHKVKNLNGFIFTTRTEKPVVDSEDIESDLYWVSSKYTSFGYNPFYVPDANSASLYDTLPNDTAYAWGRFYEILGTEPTLCVDVANKWFDYDDGYQRGQEPIVGAIMCFTGGTYKDANNSYGHVAIVERVNADGSIETSESAWNSSKYWWTTKRTKTNGSWSTATDGTFQGFIYCPTSVYIDKSKICTKNSYGISIEEMKTNAQYIWQYLGSRGWTLNAVAGLLGNLQQESKMSPCIWEGTVEGSIVDSNGKHTINNTVINNYYAAKGRFPGYGIVQWTPYDKYTSWCEANSLDFWDIDSQLKRIEYEIDNNLQWIAKPKKGYDLSFKDFATSTADAAWLAGAFAFCYERPARSTGTQDEQDALRIERGENANYWLIFLSSLTLQTVDEKLYLEDIKTNNYSNNSSTLTASFLLRNGTKASYKLAGNNEKAITISDDFITFDIANLKPNKLYELELTAETENADKLVKKVSFTTPQSYPKSVEVIELLPLDTAIPNNKFRIKTKPVSDWGYWKKNNHGYILQLIVNGKVAYEKNLSSISKTTNFKLNTYFNNYKAALGDTIQIGIRTWITDDAGNKIFDDLFAKTSNSITFLKRPTLIYLKTD